MISYFDQIIEPLLVQSYATLFFVSFIVCLVVILSSGYGFSRRSILDEKAIQSAHSGFVPRVGGLSNIHKLNWVDTPFIYRLYTISCRF